jgi:iron complex outermembrane recepter protein
MVNVRTAVACILAGWPMAALAQTAADQAPATPPPGATEAAPAIEEVEVTGTRIRRKDLEASSPLVTIDAETLETRSGLNIESYLNQLPNYNPAQVPTTENEDVQPSAVNTVGISTISLRGFGPNRSLVLVDGKRTTPVNALMVTDINTIPEAMIDRVEIITGGASATYGADAIGGVTNFILKKNYEGASLDVQDGITQAGDGNELRVSGLMGSKIAGDKGHITFGLEYYDRSVAYQKNRDFDTDAWTDPNALSTNTFNLGIFGMNSYTNGFAGMPSVAALSAVIPSRAGSVYTYGSTGAVSSITFNQGGSGINGPMWTQAGPLATSGYTGPTSGNGYSTVNCFDTTMQNTAAAAPNETQCLRFNDTAATLDTPQTRYSFFANGTYDITDKVQWYTNARFAQSLTSTYLSVPTTATFGWEAQVPFNATTDSPINPALITSATPTATLQAIAAAFTANPTASNPYFNPAFKGAGTAGAQHPVPWQLAMLLDSRGASAGGVPATAGLGIAFGGPVACNPAIAKSLCSTAPTSWIVAYDPYLEAPGRSTVDRADSWQMETGLKFPLEVSDWTGELYYSRGESEDYENGLGVDSLQRYRALIDSPDYGAGQTFQGNQNGASAGFGTTVPTTCSSGFYNTIFFNSAPSADCNNAISAVLQTYTAMEQDIVEANFNGTVFKLHAGDVSGAFGYQYRRDSGQFQPDNLQATNSFLDQAIGLYPLGTLQQQEISAKDGYVELFVPIVGGMKYLQNLNLDVGGRYSDYSNTPNAATFKVSLDAQILKSVRIRGGFNRATRAPNLGELYLGQQETFVVGGALYGDPCSLRSTAPFGAGGAAPDTSPSKGNGPTQVASGQTAAGAVSTYLICQAQMGATGTADYYGNTAQGNAAANFAWLNEEGNPNLRSETADTWTAGIVFNNLGDSPWIAGFNGSIDYWQIDIKNAIELDSTDYASFLCYGDTDVTNATEAAAQAATAACQNVARNPTTGAAETALLQYNNQATIGTAGVDLELNWFAQFVDMGIPIIPGGLSFSSQDTMLMYYKTKQSPADFDVDINWKDSLGPNLAGTNPGAYGYRLTAAIGYVLPAVSFNLRWRFLPSVNSPSHAQTAGIIQNNNNPGATILSYVPDNSIAAPAWNAFDLSFNWNINKTFSLRGGISNLFDKEPAIIGGTGTNGANTGFPTSRPLTSYCTAATAAKGCVNPGAYALPNDGAGDTNPGFYDVYGRTFFLGAKAQF